MKKILVFLFVVSVSGCSVWRDVQNHCKVTNTTGNVNTGSFKACLECDSLANVVKAQIAKAQGK